MMGTKRAFDEMFIEGAVQTVAKIGIENMRTKHAADYAGFSEATMFRHFPSKEILLRDTFLYINKQLSDILMQSTFLRSPGSVPFELGLYATWRKVYRYLLEHREETIYFIRYCYSSLYTDEVWDTRQTYNGGLERACETIEKYYGIEGSAYRGFLVNYIFEMTLGFAEKVITGKIEDNQDTEDIAWLAISGAAKSWAQKQKRIQPDRQKDMHIPQA